MLFEGKNILITGGAGFIGSNLAIRLVSEGAKVTILDSLLREYGGNLFNLKPIYKDININLSDMRDWDTLTSLVQGKDIIFNLAGQVSHQDSMQYPLLDVDLNIKSQMNILEACRLFNKSAIIVYTSTRQLYGRPQYLPVDENHPLNPPDVNGINKLATEQYHMLYNKIYGLKTVSLRLTNTYGPRMLIKNARQGFIGWFINRIITGNSIKLYGGGEQIRDFSYIDDVVDALILASIKTNCYGEIYNLSGDKASLLEIANRMIEINEGGMLEKIQFPPEREKIDIGDFYGTSNKFFDVAGWSPKVTIKDGLLKVIDYYKLYQSHYLEV